MWDYFIAFLAFGTPLRSLHMVLRGEGASFISVWSVGTDRAGERGAYAPTEPAESTCVLPCTTLMRSRSRRPRWWCSSGTTPMRPAVMQRERWRYIWDWNGTPARVCSWEDGGSQRRARSRIPNITTGHLTILSRSYPLFTMAPTEGGGMRRCETDRATVRQRCR